MTYEMNEQLGEMEIQHTVLVLGSGEEERLLHKNI